MKRDARIGLAVILVLGLAVTLLVGRALYKRGTPPPTETEEVATAGDAPTSTETHGDAAAPSTSAASAPNPNLPTIAAPNSGPATHVDTGAAHPAIPTTPGLQPFIEDERRPITPSSPVTNDHAAALVPAPTSSEPRGTKPTATPTVSSPAPSGDHNNAANSGAGWEDHESAPTPPDAHHADAPSDGYGYTVQAGDNPWKISSKVYGDGKYTQKIAEANPGLSSQKMKVGMVIKIPAIANKTVLLKLPSFAEAKQAGGGATPTGAHAATPEPVATASTTVPAEVHVVPEGSHKVEPGETLGAIAKKYYGTAGPKTIAMIVAANKGLEPTKLKVGQEIVLPAKK